MKFVSFLFVYSSIVELYPMREYLYEDNNYYTHVCTHKHIYIYIYIYIYYVTG
jgi:hypothetical protein